jgi:phosphate transport system substrate-binding protein
VTSVSRSRGGIGYVSMSYLNSSVRAVPVNSIAPTLEEVYNNSYPLRSTLYMVGLDEPEGDYRAFIGWVQSPDGQTVVGQQYAPLLKPT